MSRRSRQALTHEAAHQLKMRCAQDVRKRAHEKYRRSIAEWAAQDCGQFPTHEQAEQESQLELEILLHGLGELAILKPDDVFPHPDWWNDFDAGSSP